MRGYLDIAKKILGRLAHRKTQKKTPRDALHNGRFLRLQGRPITVRLRVSGNAGVRRGQVGVMAGHAGDVGLIGSRRSRCGV